MPSNHAIATWFLVLACACLAVSLGTGGLLLEATCSVVLAGVVYGQTVGRSA